MIARQSPLIESCDTNILFHAINGASPYHQPAASYLQSHRANPEFALCELVLVELYVLIRNPTVCQVPLRSSEAAKVIETLRLQADWAVVDYPGGLMDRVWTAAAAATFARRRIFDLRLAVTLQHYGIRRFATRNVKDFEDAGFEVVFDPVNGT